MLGPGRCCCLCSSGVEVAQLSTAISLISSTPASGDILSGVRSEMESEIERRWPESLAGKPAAYVEEFAARRERYQERDRDLSVCELGR